MKETQEKVIITLTILTWFLYILSGCASKAAYQMNSLSEPWAKRGNKLVHPDKTVIWVGKAVSYKGRLTQKNKDDSYRAVTPNKMLTQAGIDPATAKILSFSKKWEGDNFIVDIDFPCFSSASGYKAGERMTTRIVVIYRYMGENVTNRMVVGIMGYSDCVLSHTQEFGDLVDSISF